MKKFLLTLLIFPCVSVMSSELTEDYLDIATNYAIYGKYQEAMNYIDKITQLEPSNTNALELKNTLTRISNPYSKSYLSSVNGRIQQAFNFKKNGEKEKFVSILASATNDFWANYLLADYYRQNYNLSEAIYYYKNAISLKPNYSQSYLGLAQCYLENKEFLNCIDAVNKYIEYNKNSDFTYALRAEANLNLNYIIEAEEDIKKALEIEENIAYLLIEAKVLYYKGNYAVAWDKFNLLSRNVQTSEVYKYMGLCDYAMKNYSSALLNLDKAIILSDEDKSLNSTYNSIKEILENEKKEK